MDWQKIWTLLDVVHKTVNVPHTENIRNKALEELKVWNEDKVMKSTAAHPGFPAETDPEFEFGARRLGAKLNPLELAMAVRSNPSRFRIPRRSGLSKAPSLPTTAPPVRRESADE